jgi:transcription-repair coupling factor (superfamily II helicase)
LVQKKNILYLVDDKEDALYAIPKWKICLGKKKYCISGYSSGTLSGRKNAECQSCLRTEVLNKINSGRSPKVIVAYAGALSEKVLKKEDFKAISHHIKVGDQLDFDFVDELLNHYHFQQADFVSEPGEFSVRGGIVDVFSYSYEKPYRITFFGNEVESIKTFDIETQLSVDKVKIFSWFPI